MAGFQQNHERRVQLIQLQGTAVGIEHDQIIRASRSSCSRDFSLATDSNFIDFSRLVLVTVRQKGFGSRYCGRTPFFLYYW